MKWFHRSLLLRDFSGHPRNGHWNDCTVAGNMTSYGSRRCSVLITDSWSQSINGYVPCNCLWWVVMDLYVKSTQQYRHGMRHRRSSWYVATSSVILWIEESSDIPVRIAPDWQVMILDFPMLYIRPTLWKILISTLMDHWSHYKSRDPMRLSSAWKTRIILPTSIPSPSWMADSSSTVSESQCRTILSNDTLDSLGEVSTPCVVPMYDSNCGPWNPFWRATTSWRDQNFSSKPRIFGSASYCTSICSSHP